MPARNRPGLSENTRQRIRTTQLVNRLTDHAMGKIELTSAQVRSIEVLLRKTLPDLSAIDQTVRDETPRVVSSEPMTKDDWEKQYADSLAPTDGAAKGTDRLPH